MKKFSCLDPNCVLFGIIKQSPKNFFLWHLRKKPRSTLILLVEKFGLNPNPFQETNEVLRKLLLEASIIEDKQ